MATSQKQISRSSMSPGLVIKLVISIALCFGLYHQLFVRNDVVELWLEMRKQMQVAPIWMLVVIAALVPLNLMLEAMKFRLLLPRESRPSRFQALRRVCAGLSVGLFTPNRVGEYLGRLAGTDARHRAATVAATFLGGIAQWIPLLGGGVFCLIGLSQYERTVLASNLTIGAAVLICSVLVMLFIFLPQVVKFLERIWGSFRQNMSFGPKINRLFIQVAYTLRGIRRLASSRPDEVRLAILIACIRYIVYLIQLSLAFVFFGLTAGMNVVILGSGVLLFAQTFVPLPAFVQALARVELALLVWVAYKPNELSLASASFLIFVLNLGFPALLGLVEILKSDVDKTLGINA